jgi:hypothetical protein
MAKPNTLGHLRYDTLAALLRAGLDPSKRHNNKEYKRLRHGHGWKPKRLAASPRSLEHPAARNLSLLEQQGSFVVNGLLLPCGNRAAPVTSIPRHKYWTT